MNAARTARHRPSHALMPALLSAAVLLVAAAAGGATGAEPADHRAEAPRALPKLWCQWEDHHGFDVSGCTGEDCGALPVATPDDCQQACLSHAACVGFVFMPLVSHLHDRWVNGHLQSRSANYSCAAANTSGAPPGQPLCWLKEWWGPAVEDPEQQHWDPVGNRTSGCPFQVPCSAGQRGCRLSALVRETPPRAPAHRTFAGVHGQHRRVVILADQKRFDGLPL